MSMFGLDTRARAPDLSPEYFAGLTANEVRERLAQMRLRCDIARRGFHDRQTYQWLQAASRAINAAIVAMDEAQPQ